MGHGLFNHPLSHSGAAKCTLGPVAVDDKTPSPSQPYPPSTFLSFCPKSIVRPSASHRSSNIMYSIPRANSLPVIRRIIPPTAQSAPVRRKSYIDRRQRFPKPAMALYFSRPARGKAPSPFALGLATEAHSSPVPELGKTDRTVHEAWNGLEFAWSSGCRASH